MATGGYAQVSDYISQVRVLVHDPNGADYTDAALIPIINNARLRVAQDLRCVVQFITGLNTITQQESYPLNGFVGGVVVTAGGQNFPVTTGINFPTPADGNGSGAAATVTVVNGAIQTINMTNWGGGYTSPVTGVLTNVGAGTGAVIKTVTGLNIHDILQITILWSMPPSALAVTLSWLPFGAFQAFCRAYRATFANPGAFTVHYGTTNPQSPSADARQFFTYPVSNQPYPMEMNVSVLPTVLPLTTSVDFQLVSPWNDAVQYFAAHLAYLGMQQFAQAGVMKGLYDGRLKELPATGYVRRIHSFFKTYRALMGRI